MAEIRRLSQVTEAVAGVEKPLVKKAKIHFFFEPYGQLSIIPTYVLSRMYYIILNYGAGKFLYE